VNATLRYATLRYAILCYSALLYDTLRYCKLYYTIIASQLYDYLLYPILRSSTLALLFLTQQKARENSNFENEVIDF
jgi:hypothetical protein